MAHGAQGRDLEPHHRNDGDEDDPAPHTGAMHIERRMEPPVAHRSGSGNRHEQDDEGATAPLRHALHERGNGDIRANARRAARPFGLCAGGLLALASGILAFASRFPAVTGGRARLRRCASPSRGTIALGVGQPLAMSAGLPANASRRRSCRMKPRMKRQLGCPPPRPPHQWAPRLPAPRHRRGAASPKSRHGSCEQSSLHIQTICKDDTQFVQAPTRTI